ncbi:MAG: thioredoxin-disulfide reductase [Planctomycetota bacterium]
MKEGWDYDVVIVGAGPGGLCAGLYTGRASLKVVAFDRQGIGGQIANTDRVEDYPGFERIGGYELGEKMANHAKKFGLEIDFVGVKSVSEPDDTGTITVSLEDEREVKCGAVIVSTGGTAKKLGVPGEGKLTNLGVSYCALCDGAFFRDQVIGVVGGGDQAVEEAVFLTKFGSEVHLFHRRDELRAAKVAREHAFANEKLTIHWNTVVTQVIGKERVEAVGLKNVKTGEETTLELGALFPLIGFKPNNSILPESVKLADGGYVLTDTWMRTSVPGIYAVGDVREQLCRQVTNAVGDGTTASVAAEKYLEGMEH